jgi:hydrogenase-4 component B
MVTLLAACAWIGLLPGTIAPLLQAAAGAWAVPATTSLSASLAPLPMVGMLGWGLLLLLGVLGCWLHRHSRGAPRHVPTWGCGYQSPTPRMQYSASSFADLLVSQFHCGLRTERHGGVIQGLFPAAARFASHTPDVVLDGLLLPACRTVAQGCSWLRARVQNGLVPTYLMYVAMTLLVLLALVAR